MNINFITTSLQLLILVIAIAYDATSKYNRLSDEAEASTDHTYSLQKFRDFNLWNVVQMLFGGLLVLAVLNEGALRLAVHIWPGIPEEIEGLGALSFAVIAGLFGDTIICKIKSRFEKKQ
ncbi:MAG: hypothetical protein V7767_00695 [Leeuwenhoekiella sp.]